MTIKGKPFIQVHIDFTGKNTPERRQEHLEDLAMVLEQEYQDKIKGQRVECFYHIDSLLNVISLSNWDMEAFEMKIEAIRTEKNKQLA